MRSKDRDLIYIYLFFDIILLNIAIFIANRILFSGMAFSQTTMYSYLIHGNISWVITYIVFSKKNLYLRDGFYNRFLRITKRTLVFVLISFVTAFLFFRMSFSLRFYLMYSGILYLSKVLFYWGLYQGLLMRRKRGVHVSRCAIVGIRSTAKRLRKLIDYNPILGFKFVGFFANKACDKSDILGPVEELEQLLEEHKIEMLFVTENCEDIHEGKCKDFIELCSQKGIRIRFVPNEKKWNKSGSNMETMAGVPLLDPLMVPLDSLNARFWKRFFDITFSLAIILCVLTWLIPLVALMIALTSKGPVFFVQQRTGFNNRTFGCIKFRSMKLNKFANRLQATANDERITLFGRIMRRTNIDELPQFFNVLMGDMSVVGPRPHMLSHTELYSGLIDSYLSRHFVKPGITGWAQVNGLRGETDELWKMERRVEFDMEYIETWSFALDIRIILLTIFGSKTFHNAV